MAVAKDALHEYLAHLEDAFFFFTVPIDSKSERRRAVHPRKVYLVDPSLAQVACFDVMTTMRGHLLENAVYLELRRRGAVVTYQVSERGSEVDFVARYPDGSVDLVQVCAQLDSPETLRREVAGLEDLAPSYLGARLTMVTMSEENTFAIGRRTCTMIPAWRFLAEGDSSSL